MILATTYMEVPQVWAFAKRHDVFDSGYALISVALTLLFYVATTHRFWALTWWRAIAMMIVALVVSTPVWIALTAAIDNYGIARLFAF